MKTNDAEAGSGYDDATCDQHALPQPSTHPTVLRSSHSLPSTSDVSVQVGRDQIWVIDVHPPRLHVATECHDASFFVIDDTDTQACTKSSATPAKHRIVNMISLQHGEGCSRH